MKRICWLIVLLVGVCLGGCVERRMHITSEPAGALVVISDREVGRTPVTVPFTWYGDYDIILRREGYETLSTHAHITMPWYEVPPLDLLSELAPWTYRDQRYLHFEMDKLVLPSDAELLKRAKALEKKNLQPVEK